MKKFLFALSFCLLFVAGGLGAEAKSGACSNHGGVSCAAGADFDGSVICNDGWRGSSVDYSSMVSCSGSASVLTAPILTAPEPVVEPTYMAAVVDESSEVEPIFESNFEEEEEIFTVEEFNLAAESVENVFTDISLQEPNYEAILYLKENGVIKGYEDGTFRPTAEINRAEFLKILIEGQGWTPRDDYHDCFSDVNDQWFAPYVCYAKNRDWVVGYSDGTFKPSQSINKVEALKMLFKAYGIVPPLTVDNSFFEDVPATEWFAAYVETAQNLDLLEDSGLFFEPAKYITRGEISENLYRVLSKIEEVQSRVSFDLPEGWELSYEFGNNIQYSAYPNLEFEERERLDYPNGTFGMEVVLTNLAVEDLLQTNYERCMNQTEIQIFEDDEMPFPPCLGEKIELQNIKSEGEIGERVAYFTERYGYPESGEAVESIYLPLDNTVIVFYGIYYGHGWEMQEEIMDGIFESLRVE